MAMECRLADRELGIFGVEVTLFVAEGFPGIYTHGSVGWDITGYEGGQD